jgi:hypothetical protein
MEVAGISSERIYIISIIDTGLDLLGRVLNLQKFDYLDPQEAVLDCDWWPQPFLFEISKLRETRLPYLNSSINL